MTLAGFDKISVAEFLERDDFEKSYMYELIDGIIVKRIFPDAGHQNAVGNISALMRAYVKENNLGKCYVAPLDIILDDYDILQPDVFFIAKDRL